MGVNEHGTSHGLLLQGQRSFSVLFRIFMSVWGSHQIWLKTWILISSSFQLRKHQEGTKLDMAEATLNPKP